MELKSLLIEQAPIARGLGSSATCVVAGIFGAFLLTGTEINKNDILKIATDIASSSTRQEAHKLPNIAGATLSGCPSSSVAIF